VAEGSGERTLHIERVLPAPALTVFEMHAEPGLLAQWWGPKGFSAPDIELELRVGGRYRITMQPPEGDAFFLSGEFRAVDADDQETLVEFSLQDLGGTTRVTVAQGPFATEERRALHVQGWTESLDRLEALMARRV
jgi:uncharacterized protein YndB with AHSA1/START domain